MPSTSSSSTSFYTKDEIIESSNIKGYISSESSLEPHLSNEMLKSSKIKYGRNSLIEAEIDEFPFEFQTNERNDDQDIFYVKSDDESYIIDDIFKYQQLPDMTDFWEGLIGFLLTALSVSLLVTLSSLVVFGIEDLTAKLEELHH